MRKFKKPQHYNVGKLIFSEDGKMYVDLLENLTIVIYSPLPLILNRQQINDLNFSETCNVELLIVKDDISGFEAINYCINAKRSGFDLFCFPANRPVPKCIQI